MSGVKRRHGKAHGKQKYDERAHQAGRAGTESLKSGSTDLSSQDHQPELAELGDRLITKRLIFDKVKNCRCDTSEDGHYHDESDDSDYNSNEEFQERQQKNLVHSRSKVKARRDKRKSKVTKVGTQRFRNLLQGAKNPIELIVPTDAIRWRNILYAFSRILAGFGLGILVFGMWVALAPQDNRYRVLPHWTAILILPLGGASFALGILAWRGSAVSLEKLRHGRRNLWLWTLNLALTLMITLFCACLAILFFTDGAWINQSVEAKLKDDVKLIECQPTDPEECQAKMGQPTDPDGVRSWYDIQRFLICCGWSRGTHVLGKGSDWEKVPKSHSMLATGKWCTSQEATTGKPCLEALQEFIIAKGQVMMITIGVFIAIQLTVLLSSVCLSYIIKAHTPFMNI